MVTCKHAASGCNYPQGECSGACHFPGEDTQRQPAAPQYLTIVYQIHSPGQRKALLNSAEWISSSHSHAVQERDQLHADLNDVQAQRREAFRAIERLNDEIGRLTEQRDQMRAALSRLLSEVEHPTQTINKIGACEQAKGALANTEGSAT